MFGATGKIGRHVVDQLLAAGHDVTAYVRNPAKLTADPPEPHRHRGELADPLAIATAVDGADAVISALGPRSNAGPGTPVADGTRKSSTRCEAAGVTASSASRPPASLTPRTSPPSRGSSCP